MASKTLASTALLLSLNLLFFTFVTSKHTPCAPPPPPKAPKCPPPPPPKTPNCPPSPPKNPPPAPKATCPRDALKLGVCANLLNDLVHVVVGSPAKTPCCSLIQGLVDLEAAACLCTVVKANILGIKLTLPVALSLLLNVCGKEVPSGFQCA